jgi:penicillin-binding protein 1C
MKAAAIVFGAALFAAAGAASAAVPDFATVKANHAVSDARLYDRHGELIHELRVDATIRRLEWVALDNVSPALQRSVVQAEDRRFYDHAGVDWRALTVSALSFLWRDRLRGASTITMQLAARLDPSLTPATGRRSLGQKWRQIRQAQEIERSWTKAQILEAYLNLVDFRGELRGVAAAARGIFDKEPSGLNEGEALVLAALVRAPNAAPEAVALRACALGASLGAQTSREAINRLAREGLSGPLRVRQLVADAPHVARELLKRGVPRAVTTLDAALQRFVRRSLAQQLGALGDRHVREGAVLVVDNRSGEVLAYVGNRGESYVDGVVAPRQAGSTLKPFLYSLAIEQRLLTAASAIDDSPVNLVTPAGLYVPQNYDNDFKGLVSARTALASSLNVPAVKTLMLVGTDAFVTRLRRLGFDGLVEDGDYYGYSLALGSAEVTLWQLTNAYRTLANGGVYSPLTLVPRPRPKRRRVIGAGAAFIVTDILADRGARSLTFGFESVLATPFWSAVKTGTSKDMRDNWCVGYGDRFTVGVWVGNFDGAPMQDVSGITGAAPVWLDVMRYLHRGRAGVPPRPPAGVVAVDLRYLPAIENPRREWFVRGTESATVRLQTGSDEDRARIAYPARGTILALDPDIPPERQRVFFATTQPEARLYWRVDGILVPGGTWAPTAGKHRLALVGETGTALDEVTFEVRGALR